MTVNSSVASDHYLFTQAVMHQKADLVWRCHAGAVAAASIALACFNPGWAMYMTFPCLLAATLEGTLIGSLLPAPANQILHPIIVTCLVINAGAAAFGFATGMGYQHALQSYLTKVWCSPGLASCAGLWNVCAEESVSPFLSGPDLPHAGCCVPASTCLHVLLLRTSCNRWCLWLCCCCLQAVTDDTSGCLAVAYKH